MGWAFLALIVLYAVWGKRLEYKAYEHLKQPLQGGLLPAITEEDAFTEEGRRWRRRALRFWRVGGATILAVLLGILLLQRFT